LTIGYDPSDLSNSYIDLSIAGGEYDADADDLFAISTSSTGVTISGEYFVGGTATAFLSGDPGLLNAWGDPLSLNSLLGSSGSVVVTPVYNFDQLQFNGQIVTPEPSSVLMLATGIGAVASVYAVRRKRRRPDPLGLAGRWSSPART
jgi:hypothetical protein